MFLRSLCITLGLASTAAAASFDLTIESGSQTNVTVAVGDSLNITSEVEGAATIDEGCGPIGEPVQIHAGDQGAYTFSHAGTFLLNVTDDAGNVIATGSAVAVSTTMPDHAACQVNYTRDLRIQASFGDHVTFAAADAAAATVEVVSADATGVTLHVTPRANGNVDIVATIAAPTGVEEVGRTQLTGFTYYTTAQNCIVATADDANGQEHAYAELTIDPATPGLDVVLDIFYPGTVFDDTGATIMHIDSAVLSPDQPYRYRLVSAPGTSSDPHFCHTIAFYENGVQVAF